MSFTTDLQTIQSKVRTIKQSICQQILDLPDNPRINRLSGKGNCFIIQFKNLGNNWSPEFHDFKIQYKKIVEMIDKLELESILPFLKKVIEDGFIYISSGNFDRKYKFTFNPEVIEFIKNCVE